MTILHRLRAIAMIGERRDQLDDILLHAPRLVRPLLEATDPRAMAEAGAQLCDRMGVETIDHARRLEAWMLLLGSAIDLKPAEMEVVACGSLLHDIGKIAVEQSVLESST